jgi:hypothetical protein
MSEKNRISYCFHYNTDREIRFDMDFDISMQLQARTEQLPAWTELKFKQCDNCPLDPAEHSHCPIAKNIQKVVEIFRETLSTETTSIAVLTRERNYWKETSMQDGMHGIFGLIMATSGCPHMDFLKPMARFHLPFSNYDDTVTRTIAMFVLGQIVNSQNPGRMMLDFSELEANYLQVNEVNNSFIKRIRFARSGGDVGANAIVILDSFVKLIELEFTTDFSLLKEILHPECDPE